MRFDEDRHTRTVLLQEKMCQVPRGAAVGSWGTRAFAAGRGVLTSVFMARKARRMLSAPIGTAWRVPPGLAAPSSPPQLGPGLGCQGAFWSLPVGKPIPSGLRVSAPPSPHLLCLLQCFLSCAWALLIMCWPNSAEVSPAPQVLAQAPPSLGSHFSRPLRGFFLTSLKY